MRTLLSAAALAALLPLSAVAQTPAEPKPRQVKPVPALAREPKLDGNLKDFASPLTLKSTTADASAVFTARAGWRKDVLYVGVEITDNQLQSDDLLTLTLFFPDAGVTAAGHIFRFAFDGKRASPADSGTSDFAQKLVEAGVERQDHRLTFELAIPARALPRFPAVEPMTLDLCLTYDDADGGASPPAVSNCKGGGMVGEVLRLPDEFRKGLKLKPPEDVVGLEGRAGGWLGYGVLPYPLWVEGDAALKPASLESLVTPQPLRASDAGVNVPETLSLPGGKPLVAVLTGANPYASGTTCDAEKELRLGLYLVKGKTAQRVLDWPAATCALGRATSVELNEEGSLSIGYSNGPTVNFSWSGDHFERNELGMR